MKFKKKQPPEIYDGNKWEKHGDLDHISPYDQNSTDLCSLCHKPMKDHGIALCREGVRPVCPGMWIMQISGITELETENGLRLKYEEYDEEKEVQKRDKKAAKKSAKKEK